MKEKVVIVGFFREVIELCQRCDKEILGIIDNNISEDIYSDFNILGSDEDAQSIFIKFRDVRLVISPDTPYIRKKLIMYYSAIGFKMGSVISPYAKISKSASLGSGLFIQDGVNISSDARIGDFCRINTNANIMHDCIVNDFTTIAPNAVLLGSVEVEELSYIGANSTILPKCKIGTNTIVGAGSVVTKSVDRDTIVAGNPAKFLRNV